MTPPVDSAAAAAPLRERSPFLLALAVVAVLIAVVVALIVVVASGVPDEYPWLIPLVVLAFVINGLCWRGLTVVNPNTAKVVLLFGNYKGTLKAQGFWWVNPLTMRRSVSLRVRNFESSKLKVNDHIGNPIEIAPIASPGVVLSHPPINTAPSAG